MLFVPIGAAKTKIRSAKRAQEAPLEQAAQIADGQHLSAIEERFDFARILEKLQSLNDQQREVILLRFVEEMSIAETAQIMQKSEGAVKALQHRALESLRRQLQT